jgi:hypothetical protein
MQTISDLKELAVTDTPIMVFDCTLSTGVTEHWSTHAVTVGATNYGARVLQHSAFDIQTASDQGVDGSPRISLVLANADSHFSEIERATGWKGASLTVGFLFYDLRNNVPLTDTTVIFQGICNPPEQIKEATIRLSAINRMNLQRLLLPEVRIERRCPWTFPATAEQRAEAANGGADGKYSLYYRCGYSADVSGGSGNLNGTAPFTTCGYVRTDCQARGLLQRFGGLEFVPSVIAVRGYGKDWTTSALSVNQARYNDYVPMVYGTAWYEPPVVFARNDGNLTRMEVLLGIGQIQGVLTVLVSGVQIPVGVNGANMTGTGWYNLLTVGTRDGAFDMNFADASGNPAGDPYGSMAYLSVVVPNQLNNGNSLPIVQVLVQGLIVPTYAADGTYNRDQFSGNPAWILLDVLRRSGWAETEIDMASFAATAAYCDEQIQSTDLNGNAIAIPRFQCNVVLQKRKSAGDLVRGIRNADRLYLTYGPGGVLQLQVENSLSLQQPTQGTYTNSTASLNGGWPAYEFGDGSSGVSGILRQQNGAPSVTITSRSIADTPNCFTTDFQDGLNAYQQDSYTVVDPDDIALAGQQVTSTLMAIGLPNYDQAARILQFTLDKSVLGNTYIQFDTSIKGFGIKPGDIITVTYLKQGFSRQPFRVLKISPATNYRTCTIAAQIHDDGWYADTNGQSTSAPGSQQPGNAGVGVPRPLIGSTIDGGGNMQFGISETDSTNSDGSVETNLSVSFVAPSKPSAGSGTTPPNAPLIDLIATVGTGGTLTGGQTLYYAVSALNSAGDESALSFIVQAAIPQDDKSVTLTGLSFGAAAGGFNVYRGTTPANLLQVASNQTIAATFIDGGLSYRLLAPPDVNFDHANFYWRMELVPESEATIHSGTTVGNGTLHMTVNAYRGTTVRITNGTGAGQERTISTNDSTGVTVSPAWTVEPDATSYFTVAESGWHFAALTKGSPVQFVVPNLAGEVVEITGLAANVNDVECSPQLSVVTGWQIGGSGTSDTDVPGIPFFGLSPGQSEGTVDLSGVSFADMTNTQTVSSATLALYYWDELQGAPSTALASALGTADTTVGLNTPGPGVAGTILQIETELIQITAVSNGGRQYTVERGVQSSHAAAHGLGTPIYHLSATTAIAPFPNGFFGSPYCGSWTYPILLPDARVAGGQLFVTNRKGNSPTATCLLTHSVDSGLRTLSGGQYSIQVEGFLAVDQSVAPALVVDAARSVRDVFGILGAAADAAVQLQLNVNGTAYCQLTFSAGATLSSAVDGKILPPLASGAQVTLSVLSVGQVYPGADLTVLIRL